MELYNTYAREAAGSNLILREHKNSNYTNRVKAKPALSEKIR